MTPVHPAISIIMPCYNAAAHLPKSVGSLLQQTNPDWELIAIDDGSVDGTSDWLESQTDTRIHCHRQANQGVSAARNAGLALAKGGYVAFLDADDTWAPDFLEKMAAILDANPDIGLAYCGWQNIGLAGGRGNPFVPPDYETPEKLVDLFSGCKWPIHAAMTRREAFLKTKGFNHELKNAEDYALWLEIAGKTSIARVPEVLAYYHFHDGVQASSNLARSALHLLAAQHDYLARHKEFAAQLGKSRRRRLVYGGLLRQGYECYWKRDLPAARIIFRSVMRYGYGSFRDWLYMLPALLPISLHRLLIKTLERNPSGRN